MDLSPPLSPARSTSAQAVPSGNGSTPCSSTIRAVRRGTIKRTPSRPPHTAIADISRKEGADTISLSAAHINRAGRVKMAPAASDSPADPMVCTILFSSILSLRSTKRISPMEMTAAGIDADTVIPTRSPRYAFAAPNTTASMIPRIKDTTVNSGTTLSAGINGLKSFLFSISFTSLS